MVSGDITGTGGSRPSHPAPGKSSASGPTREVYADRLVRVLEEAAAEAPEGTANRWKLHAAAEAVTGAGREVMVDVAAKDRQLDGRSTLAAKAKAVPFGPSEGSLHSPAVAACEMAAATAY